MRQIAWKKSRWAASTLAHRLASYPVSVRRLLDFATPLPPLLSLLAAACGSLHLAVNTRDGTFTRKNCAMPGTLKKRNGKDRPAVSNRRLVGMSQ